VLRTANIDYNGRFCMSSAAAANLRAFGLDRGLPFPLDDVAGTDCLLLVGSNLGETMPPAMRYLHRQRERGGRLVVVDPRRTRTAESADLHLAPRPGTDRALAMGLLHLAVTEGLLDEAFIDARTTGFAQARAAAMGYWPERVERITGVPAARLREAVRLFGTAATGMVLTARGSEQHADGVATVHAWINLCLALGKAGRPGCGYGCITGQGNGQGGREHGQKADQLPGYRRIDDPAARAHVAKVWGVPAASLPGPGRSAYELLSCLGTDGGPRGLLLFGSNPAVSAPHASHIGDRLRRLDLLVVADVVLSETAALADVVLPSAQWAEEEGTTTNLEGRVLRRRRAVVPPPGVRTDLEILSALAAQLGATTAFPAQPRAVFEELRAASAGGPADYAGISYERLDAGEQLFWPCPSPEHPGTPRPFESRFATPDGRARFVASIVDGQSTGEGAAEAPDAQYPYHLTTGRLLAHYQSGAQTRRVPELAAAAPEAFVELHPEAAQRLGVGDGDPVRVTTRRGSIVAPARLSVAIRPDTVFVPFHFADAASGAGLANTLTDPSLDPVSRMPAFKACAARVESVRAALGAAGAEPAAAGEVATCES
ncbi:MAG: molybdopterin oxidoreductase family protein, partial [Micromonosporaceae bacterium]|nr:molybdopterin oxidoreductase family protein [Micromonosporaceae bacterium]